MNILFVGDIVGKPGRRAVRDLLPGLVTVYDVALVIANCENAAGGFGVTKDVVDELYDMGIHVLTSGNHIWDKKEIVQFIDDYDTLIRPANYPPATPGRYSVVMRDHGDRPVGVINIEGRVFMKALDCPFRAIDRIIEAMSRETKCIIVDFHAEATSEKQAMGWYLDGRVSAVIGTHTHVQTADERVLPHGTGYITDAGMTGALNSVLGMRTEDALHRFLTLRPNKFEVAKKNICLNGVLVDVDTSSGRCRSLARIAVPLD